MCINERHDMTLAVKVALNPSTSNQPVLFTKQINLLLELFSGIISMSWPS